jgi:hypothetical protein
MIFCPASEAAKAMKRPARAAPGVAPSGWRRAWQ